MTGRESLAERERDGCSIAQLEQNKTALCDAAPIKAAPRRRFKAAQGGGRGVRRGLAGDAHIL